MEILRFARGCENLDRLGYVSTAYVAGDREGIVREDELDIAQGFLNTYEQSKFEAETLVRETMAADLPRTVIFRPSIIVGDSRDGRTTSFNVLYCPMRIYSLGVIKALPGKPWVRLDVVPIDYVADAIQQIFLNETAVGRTFHLVAGPERSMSLQALVDKFVQIYNNHLASRGLVRRLAVPEIVGENEGRALLDQSIGSMPTGQARNLFEMFRFFIPYTQKDKMFDNRSTRRVLTERGIEPPPCELHAQGPLVLLRNKLGAEAPEEQSLEAEVWLEEELERIFSPLPI